MINNINTYIKKKNNNFILQNHNTALLDIVIIDRRIRLKILL